MTYIGQLIDLTGQKFGRLTVIRRAEDYIDSEGKHRTQWLCKCECGNTNEIIIKSKYLRNGDTQSCGCLHKEQLINRNKKYNQYDLSNKYGIGYTSNTNKPFYFDLEDYDKIKDYCWSENKGYIISHYKTSCRIFLHRLILPCGKNMVVDHINHNTFDNRKENLRICTVSQNGMNQKLSIRNTSGVKGVSWDNKYHKWHSQIRINNKTMNLGYFINKSDAVEARLTAEVKYFGDFRYQEIV